VGWKLRWRIRMIGSSDGLKKNKVDAVYHAADDPVIVTDIEGRIISLSKGSEALLGYAYEDLRGSAIDELFSEDGESNGRGLLSKVIEEGHITDHRLTCYTKGGGQIDVIFSSSILTDERGLPQGTINVLRDITREVKAEDEVREYINQIKDYVRQVEHVNVLKDLFADILRHDIINPLTVIKNVSATLLTDPTLTPAERPKIELIKKNAEKLEKIIESATLYGKLENMSEIPVYEEDLWLILDKAEKSLHYLAEAKSIKVKFEGTGQKAPALINPIIEDAFVNLLSNAIKYSPEGGLVSVSIADEDGYWLVKVKDGGEGIPDTCKEIIFERFERGGKEGVKGTGLGLAIVKRIVELHKGEVWVEANQPQGSVFCVKLPKNN
jgi:PAS domain S-box-containing protein